MKAREYAISVGLAKPGRGKLSFAAHAAIQKAIADGVKIEDYNQGKVGNVSIVRTVGSNDGVVESPEKPATPTPLPENPVTHEYRVIYGIDTRGRSPIVIGFEFCAKCLKQIIYCLHAVPQLPEWIGGGDGLTTLPTESQLWEAMSVTHPENAQSTKPFLGTK
jgi:hypothetical protein